MNSLLVRVDVVSGSPHSLILKSVPGDGSEANANNVMVLQRLSTVAERMAKTARGRAVAKAQSDAATSAATKYEGPESPAALPAHTKVGLSAAFAVRCRILSAAGCLPKASAKRAPGNIGALPKHLIK